MVLQAKRPALLAGVIVALLLAAAAAALYFQFSQDEKQPPQVQPGGQPGFIVHPPLALLELNILLSDVIARVRLDSVDQAVEKVADYPYEGATSYVNALEYTFDVLEYLKGSGGSEVVGVTIDLDASYDTRQEAEASNLDFLSTRDTRWDGRAAIVFLRNAPLLPSSAQADRYEMGALRFDHKDYYTIASDHARLWLPAASASGPLGAIGGGLSSGEQRFLLEAPSSGWGRRTGALSNSKTITLAAFKNRIAAIDAEIAAGDGTDEYYDCVVYKYDQEAWTRSIKRALADTEEGYFRKRHDHSVGSGLPAGTNVFTYEEAHTLVEVYGDSLPSRYALAVRLFGRDSELFEFQYPDEVSSARPLPAGEYRFYFNHTPKPFIVCDGLPEEERKRHERFVAVAAPAGTVHEAFFDPVTVGQAVGADGSNGVLKPAEFTVGGTATTMQGLKWESGSVVLTLSPYTALTGVAIDFIALDGSVTFSLGASAATADNTAGTLTWSVSEQPWQAGDKLMLRIREGSPTSSLSPTT